MYKPLDITNYFIKTYASNGALTPMKLIKLTYISYAWYLTLMNGEKYLISEKPQAWDYGPVFPSLYQDLKQYGKIQITKPIKPLISIASHKTISKDVAEFLDKMWDLYGQYGGVYLSAITHTSDSPWDRAFRKHRNATILDSDILEHYKPRLKTRESSDEHATTTTT